MLASLPHFASMFMFIHLKWMHKNGTKWHCSTIHKHQELPVTCRHKWSQITVLERQFRFINSTLFTAYSTSVNRPCMKDYRAPNGLLSDSELITSIKVGQLNQMVAKKRASAETSLKCRAQNNGWLMDKSSGQKFCLPVILNGPVHKGPKINFFYKSTAFQEDKHPFHRNYGTNLTYLSSFGISVIGKAP